MSGTIWTSDKHEWLWQVPLRWNNKTQCVHVRSSVTRGAVTMDCGRQDDISEGWKVTWQYMWSNTDLCQSVTADTDWVHGNKMRARKTSPNIKKSKIMVIPLRRTIVNGTNYCYSQNRDIYIGVCENRRDQILLDKLSFTWMWSERNAPLFPWHFSLRLGQGYAFSVLRGSNTETTRSRR